ncbi:MAG TPA: sigma-70 family RNA polymerase sigma factor [Thermoanaerobaculia bacterium]|nr:sigma-70 family RNA polymerase sigma factor [Thermoanaerobaculia bacterium]
MTAEEQFLQNITTIERICAFVCRRNHLVGDEAADFTAEVKLKLVEGDYGIIRKFEGRSSFSTYLTTVIQRLFHQYRVEQWGKWRPSAEAKRLGDKAITLERLITRDGLTLDEAVKTLTTPQSSCYTVAELESIYLRLPLRNPRPVLVSEEVSPDAAAVDAEADDRVMARDRERAARSTMAALDVSLDKLDVEDRQILKMRFWEGQKVPEIARRMQLDQKKVYKKLDKLFLMLRRELERAGIRSSDVEPLLTTGDYELHLNILAGNPALSPSHRASGKVVEGGEGRLR